MTVFTNYGIILIWLASLAGTCISAHRLLDGSRLRSLPKENSIFNVNGNKRYGKVIFFRSRRLQRIHKNRLFFGTKLHNG